MKKTLVFACIVLTLCLPALAGLPSLKKPSRPATSLHTASDGQDIVLTWTISPAGTWKSVIVRGVSQACFRAEVVVATLDPGVLTWRDVGARTRTRIDLPVNEFYRVYAIPATEPAPLAPKTRIHEYREQPRDQSQVLRFNVSNGSQFVLNPLLGVIGRDGPWKLGGVRSSQTGFLFDILNLPTPHKVIGDTVFLSGQPGEDKPATWLHTGYYAVVLYVPPNGDDATVTGAPAREIEAPAVSREGNVVTVSTTDPIQDTAGIITGIQWYRSFKGVGGGEPMTLLAATPLTTLEIQDNIGGVTVNSYVFYSYRLVYLGGVSDLSRSSDPVRR